MSQKTKKQLLGDEVVKRLKEIYPTAECALKYNGEPWKLLIMGRLSAQCTDARVNTVCEELFSVYPTLRDIATADVESIENIVRPCGLFRTKAQNIKDSCLMLLRDFGGILPREMDELLLFPGVGRKIANLLLGDIYKMPAIVADTHLIRICGRLGFYPETQKDPVRVEREMLRHIEPPEQSDFCHRIVWFGREHCIARSPRCETCPLADLCKHNKTKK